MRKENETKEEGKSREVHVSIKGGRKERGIKVRRKGGRGKSGRKEGSKEERMERRKEGSMDG